MKTLVVGATGATGRLLVEQLLDRGQHVKAIVRSAGRLPQKLLENRNLSVFEASILDLTDGEMDDQVRGYNAIVSCLGHNLSFKGVFGKPRRLVTDAVRRLCDAVQRNDSDIGVKFVLMNTTGNRNRDEDEKVSLAHQLVVGLLRVGVPPHADNVLAAE